MRKVGSDCKLLADTLTSKSFKKGKKGKIILKLKQLSVAG
jgi:hypothetical protein